jgi:hypothetical protein
MAGSRLPSAALRLPFILCLHIADSLPLEVRDRIRTATGERHDVVLDVTGTRTGRLGPDMRAPVEDVSSERPVEGPHEPIRP